MFRGQRRREQQRYAGKVRDILEKMGIASAPIPVAQVAKYVGATVMYSPYDEELSGMLYRDDRQIIIGVNSLHHPNRQRFTIAHELGHLLLHEGRELFVDSGYRVDFRSSRDGDPQKWKEEMQANMFAAELLMPNDMIMAEAQNLLLDVESDDFISELAEKYAVSTQAMSIRLSTLLSPTV